MDLTNEQWRRIEPLVPPMQRKPGGRGRPPREPREVLNGILWVLRTGAPWKDLPDYAKAVAETLETAYKLGGKAKVEWALEEIEKVLNDGKKFRGLS